jgi:P-loop Domain of unknown function (DUF2791)
VDFYVLLKQLRHVFAGGKEAKYLVPDEGLKAFMEHCSKRIGDAYFRTPRNTITAFINLLSVLDQNPKASWQELLGGVQVLKDEGPDTSDIPDADVPASGDDLASFRL